MSTLFVIVGKNDKPLYSFEYSDAKKFLAKDETYLNHFIVHSSLDIVEETVWKNNAMYLKTIDRYGALNISSYVSPSHVKFMLLHNLKNEDSIKNFFVDVHEFYLKILMNPFYEVNTPITSKVFDDRVKQLALKKLF
jgi:hypothetical protein